MKKTAFIFSNSNLFTVYSQKSLRHYYNCKVLNVRYSNEEMSRSDHFIQQVKELFHQDFYEKGLLFTRYDFSFNNRLSYRIDEVFKEGNPSMVFFEMKTFKESEWMLLSYLQEKFNVPVAAFVSSEHNTDKNVHRLLKLGVKEVITKLDSEIFESVAIRNIKTRS